MYELKCPELSYHILSRICRSVRFRVLIFPTCYMYSLAPDLISGTIANIDTNRNVFTAIQPTTRIFLNMVFTCTPFQPSVRPGPGQDREKLSFLLSSAILTPIQQQAWLLDSPPPSVGPHTPPPLGGHGGDDPYRMRNGTRRHAVLVRRPRRRGLVLTVLSVA